MKGHLNICKLFFSEVLPSGDFSFLNADSSGCNPFMAACIGGNVEILELILNYVFRNQGKDGVLNLIFQLDNLQRNCFMFATIKGDLNIAQFLCNYLTQFENEVDDKDNLVLKLINQADHYGMQPIHHASRFGNVPFLQFLLSKGATMNKKDDYERTPTQLGLI